MFPVPGIKQNRYFRILNTKFMYCSYLDYLLVLILRVDLMMPLPKMRPISPDVTPFTIQNNASISIKTTLYTINIFWMIPRPLVGLGAILIITKGCFWLPYP